MKLLAWIVKTPKKHKKLNYLHDIIMRRQIDIAFVMETKSNQEMSHKRLNSLPFRIKYIRSSIGLKGGSQLTWNREVELDIIEVSEFHLYATIQKINKENFWTAFIQAPYTIEEIANFWKNMDRLFRDKNRELFLVTLTNIVMLRENGVSL